MRYYVIGDEDMALGFRYAGVPGTVVNGPDEARRALEAAEESPDIGVIIMSQRAADWVRDEVDRVRFDEELPLLVEIPGPDGPLQGRRTLIEMIREAVGVRL